MSDPGAESGEPSAVGLLADRRLLTILTVSLVGTLSSNVASPALPGVAAAFSISSARVALMMTAFTLPTIATVPLTGAVADTYGRRPVVIPSIVAFGAAGVAIAAAPSFEVVLLLRGLQGAAFAGFMPVTITILGDLYAGPTGSTAQGLRVSLNGVSSVVTPAVVGVLVALAWQYPFLLTGLAFPVAVLAYLVLPETGGVRAEGDASVLETLRAYPRDIWNEVDDTHKRTLLFGGFARDLVRLTVMTFVPLYAVDALGASPVAAGIAVSMRGVSRVVVSPLAGAFVRRFSERGALVLALGTIAGGAGAIGLAPSVPVLWAVVALFGAGDSLLAPVLKNAVTGMTTDEYRAGVINGMQVLKSAAQTIAPVLFGGVLALAGYKVVFLAAGACAAAYAVAVFVVLRS